MIRRCYNPNEPSYRFYGAIGIDVCEEWKNSPIAFIEWCQQTYPNQGEVSLDRIDGSKGYSPENCRWANRLEQSHNLKNNRFVTVCGETHCVTEWCSMYGISPGAIYKRVNQKGQTFETAILELLQYKGFFLE